MAVRKAAANWNEVKDTGDKSFEEPNAKSQQSVLLAGKGVRLTEPDEAPSPGRRKIRRLFICGIGGIGRHTALKMRCSNAFRFESGISHHIGESPSG